MPKKVVKKEAQNTNNTKKSNKFLDLFKSYQEPEDNSNKIKITSVELKTTPTKNIIISFVVGLFIGLMIMLLLLPDRIAKLENGEEVIVQIGEKTITADNLYLDMKENYTISLLIQKIDNIILSELYPEDNEMKTAVNETADYYIATYETYYGNTVDQFLSSNGYKNRDDYLEKLKLDYRRNKYYKEYVKSLITDKEINDYYNNNVFGSIGTKYISISIDDTERSKIVLQTILNELKSGSTYEEVVKKFKADIKYQDLEYIDFDTEIDTSYLNILKKLSDNTYSTVPLQSSTDYKIIFRTDQKDKEELDTIKDKIINKIANYKEANDKTLYYKALNKLRADNKVVIKDTELATKYENYIRDITNN